MLKLGPGTTDYGPRRTEIRHQRSEDRGRRQGAAKAEIVKAESCPTRSAERGRPFTGGEHRTSDFESKPTGRKRLRNSAAPNRRIRFPAPIPATEDLDGSGVMRYAVEDFEVFRHDEPPDPGSLPDLGMTLRKKLRLSPILMIVSPNRRAATGS